MSKSLLQYVLAGTTLFLVGLPVANVSAQDGATEEKPAEEVVVEKKEEVQLGVIASTGSNRNSRGVDVQTIDSAPGDAPSAILANVSQKTDTSCEIKLENVSKENSYFVAADVEGYNDSGRKQFSKYFSASLRPESSMVRSFSCRKGLQMQVVLKKADKK